MVSPVIKEAILEQLDRLDSKKQQQVLDFARALAVEEQEPRGVPGTVLLEFFQSLDPIDPQDLRMMEEAIEEGCERIDWDEW